MAAARRIMARCDALAELSDLATGIRRVYLSAQHRLANERVGAWMREAGMAVRQDAAGSICGRYAGSVEDAPALVVGSHLDTVPNAGRYDGILGVLLGIAAVEALNGQARRLPFPVEVVGFGEEEGVRFGTTLITSRAFAGAWDANWLTLRDAADVDLAAAMKGFGLPPEAIADASRAANPPFAYLEPHIEQGPVLEDHNLPLGVVNAIVGCRRFLARVDGAAGHAGTMPMRLRRDALAGAAEAVTRLEALARRRDAVATVGQLDCRPGAVNVVPGMVEFSVDVRAGDDARRDALVAEFEAELTGLCAARNLVLSWRETHNASAAQCAPWLQAAFSDVLRELGTEPLSLDSGAGHDAMAVAELCDVGMLFIRCADGVSHHPAESVTAADVAWALAALQRTLEHIAQTRT